jgi:hypothetical protein
LLSRNGDGGQEGLFGRRRVRRIALEQNLAVDAMQCGFTPALAGQLDFLARLF